MQVLICGGRDFRAAKLAYLWLDGFHAKHKITRVIEGGARGADTLGRNWALINNIPLITVPAEWNKYRQKAGIIRNQFMLRTYGPQYILAMPGGNGTAHMCKIAHAAGVPIVYMPFVQDSDECP